MIYNGDILYYSNKIISINWHLELVNLTIFYIIFLDDFLVLNFYLTNKRFGFYTQCKVYL